MTSAIDRLLKIDEHSLYYLHTSQFKHNDSIHEFTALTLLDDVQIDFYNSTDGVRTPKQDWLKEINGSDWERGSAELRDNGQYLNFLLNKQMMVFGHIESGDHILHWKYGCEAVEHQNGSMTVFSFTNDYSYDGENFISYDWNLQLWSASVKQAYETEKKWNTEHHQNRVLQTCVDWLKIYLKKSPEIEKKPPVVSMFITSSPPGPNLDSLTCVATGFYPKYLKMILRISGVPISEDQIKSTGVRPSGDGTYNLSKTVEVLGHEKFEYDCYVTHSSLEEPIIKNVRWIYWLVGGVFPLAMIILIVCIHHQEKIMDACEEISWCCCCIEY
ncbi:HLA class I histocompatibility antigen, alpha chain E-like [Astyanax mexicanus]|uniref:HLA class I histocompatibility antigen, alpha chain E-like n=1 Tax=Astyanax mexicanus TaxID=7994 RepID=A0A8T2MKY5_ASTMX|nr:HLA class I histocompatibility antigen, alpha chain E-like [Astyanax mexicanus]